MEIFKFFLQNLGTWTTLIPTLDEARALGVNTTWLKYDSSAGYPDGTNPILINGALDHIGERVDYDSGFVCIYDLESKTSIHQGHI
mgnify:CR=1 FL=1